MGAARLVDHAEHEEPARTIRAKQRLIAGSPFQGRAKGRGRAGRLPQMRIRHVFGSHDTLRSVKTEREPEHKRLTWSGTLRYRDFRFFWAARAISVAGDRISVLALPTIAILILQASPAQVGVLNAAGTLAWP